MPGKLYRVDCPGSRTPFASTEGFSASDTTKVYGASDLVECKQAIVYQFTCSCRARLPFISLFPNHEHGENWGQKEPWRGRKGHGSDRSLHLIDPTTLKDTHCFFKLTIYEES
jgi:hypothetical protein